MTDLPPLPRDQRKIDLDHLNLLAIFHFVGAGLALFGILFVLGHFAVMRAVIMDPAIWQNQKQGPPPAEFFAAFQYLYLLFAIWFVASGILNLISGCYLRVRKHWTFSMVVAGINCLHLPLGTVLGVFTIVVLMRDSVRELYET